MACLGRSFLQVKFPATRLPDTCRSNPVVREWPNHSTSFLRGIEQAYLQAEEKIPDQAGWEKGAGFARNDRIRSRQSLLSRAAVTTILLSWVSSRSH